MTEPRIADLAEGLRREHPPVSVLWLDVAGLAFRVESNAPELVQRLAGYFAEIVVPPSASANVVVQALQVDSPPLALEFSDWPREAGKRGKKEAYANLDDGRVVYKLRTGMQFLLGAGDLVAVGNCLANDNQVVNFINAQVVTHYLHQGWALCHAAGVCRKLPAAGGPWGLGIAARAGAGKSTLALHLMNRGYDFVSNDRLLARRGQGGVEMAGIPKMPRVNPGTLLNNAALRGLLSPARAVQLDALSQSALWDLEEKHDVPVARVYGRGRCTYRTRMRALLVLNWHREAASDARFELVSLASRPDLLGLVAKSPGVFHREASGAFSPPDHGPSHDGYLRELSDVLVVEATGRASFDAGVAYCEQLLEQS